MRKLLVLITLLIASCGLRGQNDIIYLWRHCDNDSMKVMKSRLYVYEPEITLKTGTAVIICPGGSYHHLGMKKEGYEIAELLNKQGITAFVLRYRVSSHGFHYPAMIEDIQRSIQYVRDNSTQYGIDSNRIGVMGFSAGGHLAAMAGEYGDVDYLKMINLQNTTDLKPNFVVAVYPVISMQDEIAHKKSRRNLLGKNYTEKLKDYLSLEINIPYDMPPTFIVACKDDPVVDYRNGQYFADSLKSKGIDCELMLYEEGGHGFGTREKKVGVAAGWYESFFVWLNNLK